jgi:hypothetical protein
MLFNVLSKVVNFVVSSYRFGSRGKLDIYDGANASAPQLASITADSYYYSATNRVKEFITTQRYMFIIFTSPGNIGSSGGFNATYSTANAINTSGNFSRKLSVSQIV